MSTLPAIQRTVDDLVAEYQVKDAAVLEEIQLFEQAMTRLKTAAVVQGHYVGPVLPSISVWDTTVRKNLLKSGWGLELSKFDGEAA
jgi:hypothetical protein